MLLSNGTFTLHIKALLSEPLAALTLRKAEH